MRFSYIRRDSIQCVKFVQGRNKSRKDELNDKKKVGGTGWDSFIT